MDILSTIVANKRKELAAADNFKKNLARPPLSMKQSLAGSPSGIIAEFKRRSPSQGLINPMADVETIVKGYASNGATACSILCDTRFFGGSFHDLAIARQAAPATPLLCKEFIVNEQQIVNAKGHGADAVLLIAKVLEAKELAHLTQTAHDLGLEVLCETHDLADVEKVTNTPVDMIGVNNRNLADFSVALDNASKLMELLPPQALPVAESGIKTSDDLLSLRSKGYRGFLIGTTFMHTDNPPLTLKNFIDELK